MAKTGFVERIKGKIRAHVIYLGTGGIVAGGLAQNQLSLVWTNAGAPTNGGAGTLANYAQPGDLLIDSTNKVLYQNTNTSASPTWTLIESGGTLPSAAKGTLGSGTGTFGLAVNVNAQFSAAGSANGADTTEDTLFTYSLPANSLDANGRVLEIQAWGSFANNNHSKHARLYFGSEVIDSGANTTTGGIGWFLSATVIRTGSKTQSISGQLIAGTTHGGCTTQAGAEDDTAAITIKATGQTGTSAANDILCNGFTVTALN